MPYLRGFDVKSSNAFVMSLLDSSCIHTKFYTKVWDAMIALRHSPFETTIWSGDKLIWSSDKLIQCHDKIINWDILIRY